MKTNKKDLLNDSVEYLALYLVRWLRQHLEEIEAGKMMDCGSQPMLDDANAYARGLVEKLPQESVNNYVAEDMVLQTWKALMPALLLSAEIGNNDKFLKEAEEKILGRIKESQKEKSLSA